MKSHIYLILTLCALATAGFAASKPVKPDVLAPVEDQPGLPRMLLIGDSISKGYTLPVRELLKDKANVHRIPANGGPTIRGLQYIDKWLATDGADKKWDVIHFSFGIRGLKITYEGRGQVEPEEYEKSVRT